MSQFKGTTTQPLIERFKQSTKTNQAIDPTKEADFDTLTASQCVELAYLLSIDMAKEETGNLITRHFPVFSRRIVQFQGITTKLTHLLSQRTKSPAIRHEDVLRIMTTSHAARPHLVARELAAQAVNGDGIQEESKQPQEHPFFPTAPFITRLDSIVKILPKDIFSSKVTKPTQEAAIQALESTSKLESWATILKLHYLYKHSRINRLKLAEFNGLVESLLSNIAYAPESQDRCSKSLSKEKTALIKKLQETNTEHFTPEQQEMYRILQEFLRYAEPRMMTYFTSAETRKNIEKIDRIDEILCRLRDDDQISGLVKTDTNALLSNLLSTIAPTPEKPTLITRRASMPEPPRPGFLARLRRTAHKPAALGAAAAHTPPADQTYFDQGGSRSHSASISAASCPATGRASLGGRSSTDELPIIFHDNEPDPFEQAEAAAAAANAEAGTHAGRLLAKKVESEDVLAP